jgi:hypothetical protein
MRRWLLPGDYGRGDVVSNHQREIVGSIVDEPKKLRELKSGEATNQDRDDYGRDEPLWHT